MAAAHVVVVVVVVAAAAAKPQFLTGRHREKIGANTSKHVIKFHLSSKRERQAPPYCTHAFDSMAGNSDNNNGEHLSQPEKQFSQLKT